MVMFKYSIPLSDIDTEINADEMIRYLRSAPKWSGGEKGYKWNKTGSWGMRTSRPHYTKHSTTWNVFKKMVYIHI